MKKGPLRVLLATFIFAAPAFASATTLYHQRDHSQLVYTAPASYQDAGYWAALNLPVVATGQPLYWWLNAKLPQQETILSFNAPNTPPSCTVRFEQTPTPGWVRAYAHPFCTTGSGARADLPTFSADSIIRVGVLGSLGPGGELYGGGMPPAGSQSCRDEQTGNDVCAAPPALFITDDANTVPEPLVPLPPNDTSTHLIGTYYQGYYFSLAGSPYVIDGPVYIRAGAVTVEPGVVFKFRNAASSLSIHSETQTTFSATPGSPIYFTSYKDDTHGGDTNGDGGATSPAPGDWGYLSLGCDQPHVYDHVHVLYGGALAAGGDAALYLCSPRNFFTLYTIRHIEVAYSLGGLALMNGGSTAWVTDSSFHDNVNFAVRTDAAPFVPWSNTFVGNWWGSPTGPQASDNPGGTGDRMLGSGVTVPFLTEDPFPVVPPPPTHCTPGSDPDCNSSVLFLPGLEASRLYDTDNGETRLWEPGSDANAIQLAMTSEGGSVRPDIYTRDVIDNAYVPFKGDVYKSYIEEMNNLKTAGKIADWKAVAYDWRLSLEDVITHGKDIGGNISYLTATDTPYIEQELRRLARESRTGKVAIIAHSNGGLVAKALMQKLGASTTAALIDKVIFVASPQVGTPQGLAALLHGHETALPISRFPYALTEVTARSLAGNMPGLYTLLPSANYFAYVHDPVIAFSTTTDPLYLWAARYGDVIHSQEGQHDFLTDSLRYAPSTDDLENPTILRNTLLTDAETAHQTLDTWVPPAGVEVLQIAGWGIPTTVSGISYVSSSSPGYVVPSLTFTVDGDGTVVVPSALWTSTTTGAANYWVDLGLYNRRHPITTGFGLFPFKHANIFEAEPTLQFISDTVTNDNRPLADYDYISTLAPASTGHRLRYSLHSPLTLSLYDDQGRHTGISTTTGEVEEQVPGTYYMEFGEVKYIFTDASTSARIIMDGYAPGIFTFNVDEFAGDTPTASTTFKDIPTTASTIVTLSAESDLATLSSMHIDKNGDGTDDAVLAPVLGRVVTLDTAPPEIRITFSTSTNALLFDATDDSGSTTVTATTTYLALKKKEKKPHGMATTTLTARDATGNTTVLVYTEKLPSPAQRDSIVLKELSYNGATTTLASTTLSYKWRQHKDGSYKLFASHLQTTATSTESHYRPKKDVTVIMTKPHDLDDDDSDDDVDVRPTKEKLRGLVIPYMRTEEGEVIIGY